ncbi:MAG: ABC transporter permease, partial [Terrisporobacter sp.]|uniref:ABC transporter permease n=1 Tax=Terrisporobacter sp. TaxID=1965305 RepID=UPI002FCB9C93
MYNIEGLEMLYGRFYTQKDCLYSENVIVIDEASAKNLFGEEDVVGETVNIGSVGAPKKATIIGVSKSSGLTMGGEGMEMPIIVYTPITFAQQLFPETVLSSIYIIANTKE